MKPNESAKKYFAELNDSKFCIDNKRWHCKKNHRIVVIRSYNISDFSIFLCSLCPISKRKAVNQNVFKIYDFIAFLIYNEKVCRNRTANIMLLQN